MPPPYPYPVEDAPFDDPLPQAIGARGNVAARLRRAMMDMGIGGRGNAAAQAEAAFQATPLPQGNIPPLRTTNYPTPPKSSGVGIDYGTADSAPVPQSVRPDMAAPPELGQVPEVAPASDPTDDAFNKNTNLLNLLGKIQRARQAFSAKQVSDAAARKGKANAAAIEGFAQGPDADAKRAYMQAQLGEPINGVDLTPASREAIKSATAKSINRYAYGPGFGGYGQETPEIAELIAKQRQGVDPATGMRPQNRSGGYANVGGVDRPLSIGGGGGRQAIKGAYLGATPEEQQEAAQRLVEKRDYRNLADPTDPNYEELSGFAPRMASDVALRENLARGRDLRPHGDPQVLVRNPNYMAGQARLAMRGALMGGEGGGFLGDLLRSEMGLPVGDPNELSRQQTYRDMALANIASGERQGALGRAAAEKLQGKQLSSEEKREATRASTEAYARDLQEWRKGKPEGMNDEEWIASGNPKPMLSDYPGLGEGGGGQFNVPPGPKPPGGGGKVALDRTGFDLLNSLRNAPDKAAAVASLWPNIKAQYRQNPEKAKRILQDGGVVPENLQGLAKRDLPILEKLFPGEFRAGGDSVKFAGNPRTLGSDLSEDAERAYAMANPFNEQFQTDSPSTAAVWSALHPAIGTLLNLRNLFGGGNTAQKRAFKQAMKHGVQGSFPELE